MWSGDLSSPSGTDRPSAYPGGNRASEQTADPTSTRSTPTKLIALAAVGVLLPLLILLSALLGLREVNQAHDQSAQIHVAQRYQQDADQMHDAIHSVVLRAVLSGLTKNQSTQALITSDLRDHVAEIDADVNNIKVPGLDADVRDVATQLTSYVHDAQVLVPLAFTEPAAAETQLPAFEDAFHRLETVQATLTNQIVAASNRADARGERAEVRAQAAIVATAAVTFVLMLLLGALLIRSALANSKLLARVQREARSRAEVNAQLNAAQELAHMGSWEAEPGNNYASVSDEMFRIMGVPATANRVKIGQYRQLVHPDDVAIVESSHQEALAAGSTVHTMHRIIRPDGRVRDIRSRVTATPGDGGGLVLSGIVQDVTDQRAVERMKDEFVSVISHELRTPLTSIRGALGLLAGGALGPLSPQAQRMTDIAVGSSERLVRLINDILDVERMAAGKLMMKLASWPALDLLDAAASEMSAMAGEAGVTVTVGDVAGTAWADRDRIAQTLTNLISNAIKFSPRGGAVQLSTSTDGNTVTFRVTDQGRGIPADQLESVFDRFAQVDASDAREKGGSGLGLAICRGIVEQHGGRIWAEPVPSGGTSINFTLPSGGEGDTATAGGIAPAAGTASLAGTASVTGTASAAGTVSVAGTVSATGGRGPALICDDDPDVVDVLATMLETHGHPTLRAHTGKQALALAQREHPSVIVLDLVMPGMSGWDTLSELRSHAATRDIPVVILSALNPDEAQVADVSDWVTKPVDIDALLGALRHAVHEDDQPTVLVIEDDAALAQVLAAMFERHGVRAITAATGREAVAISEAEAPDVVVLDLGLPDIDGFAVVAALRKNPNVSHAPLVVYSGTDVGEGDRRRLRLGETRFLAKGRVTPDEFERQVVGLLDHLRTGAQA